MRKTRRKSNLTYISSGILSKYEKEFKDNKIKKYMKNHIIDIINDELYCNDTMLDFYLYDIIAGIMLKYIGDKWIDYCYVRRMIIAILMIKYDQRMLNQLSQDAINKEFYRFYIDQDIKEEMSIDHILDIDYLINMLRNIETDDEDFKEIINDDFWDMFSKFEPEIELLHYNPLKELVSKYKHEFHYGYIKKYMHKDIINALRLYYDKYDIDKQLYKNAYEKLHKAVEKKDELNIICYGAIVNALWYDSDDEERDQEYYKSLTDRERMIL